MIEDNKCTECKKFPIQNKKHKLCTFCEFKRKNGKTKQEDAQEKQKARDLERRETAKSVGISESDREPVERAFVSKKPQKPLKRTALKQKFRKPTGELEIFREIWQEREHVSEISGIWLGDDMDPHFMSHVCSKGAYGCDLIRLYKRNIILKTKEEHDHWETGDRDKLREDSRWDFVFKRQEEVRRYYYESLGKEFDDDN